MKGECGANLAFLFRGKDRGAAIWLGLALLVTVLQPPAVLAQEELPPFPMLYGGRAFVNGQPLPEGTRLTARVADYEAWSIVEKDGAYRNLLVAPPNRDYYLKPVTFHALGLIAEEQDIFGQAGAPVFKETGFDLHFRGPSQDPVPSASPAPNPTATSAAQVGDGDEPRFSGGRLVVGVGIILAVLAGWWLLRTRWTK